MQCNFDVLLLAFHGELELGKKNTVSELGNQWGFDQSYPRPDSVIVSAQWKQLWYVIHMKHRTFHGNHPFWGTPILGTPHVWNIRVMVIETTRMERNGSFRLLVLDLLCRSQLVLPSAGVHFHTAGSAARLGTPLLIPILRRSQDLWAFGSSPSAKWGPLEL